MCVDDFTTYIMVEPLKDKRAETVLKCFEQIVQREGFKYFPSIVYCDKESEFDTKLFTDPKSGF